MKHQYRAGKNSKKTNDDLVKPTLLINNLTDLPVGIIVCKPIRNKDGFIINLKITFFNSFARSLLIFDHLTKESLFLDKTPYMRTLLKIACQVMETGVPSTIELHDNEKDYWIESTIIRQKKTCLIYLQNNTSRKKYENNLYRKLQLNSIISVISNRLISITSNDLDSYIVESLRQIGMHNEVDRAYISKCSPDEKSVTRTHEWCAEHIESQQLYSQNVSTESFHWWYQTLINQEVVLLTSLNELPASAVREKESLIAQNIQSLIVIPMVSYGKTIGFIGFDAVRQQRNWENYEIDLLKTFAALVITAQNRLSREQLLERTNERLAGLNRISNVLLNSSLRDEQPARTALKHIYELIPCEVGIIFRIDGAGQFASAESQMRRGQLEDGPAIRFPAKYLYHTLFSQGKGVLINQLQADDSGFPTTFNPYNWGHRSFLAIPLLAQQQYIGLLILLDKSPDFFTQEHLFIAREVSSQVSILLFQETVHQQLITKTNQLDENHQLLQAVIDNIPVGLILWQPIRKNGRIIDFKYLVTNPVMTVIARLSQKELLGKSLITLFPHVLETGLFDKIVKTAESGETQRFDFLYKRPTGDFWGDFSLIWVGDNLLLTVNDITQLKQIEEQLRQNNLNLKQNVADRSAKIQELSAMQQAILKYAGLAIAVTNTKAIIKLVNPALEAMTGYKADELIGKVTPGFLREPEFFRQQIDQLKPEMDDPFLEGEELIGAYVIKNDFLQRENTLLTKQGKLIPVLSTVSGLYDDQKNLIGFVDLATDISYLKTIEQDLIQANQRIQLATMAGKLGVWEWNLITDEVVLDENFFTLFGMAKKLAGNQIGDFVSLVHPDDLLLLRQHIQQAIDQRSPLDVEYRVILPSDQSIHYMKADGLFLQNEVGKTDRLIGVIRDQTATKQADQALKASEQRYRSLVDHLKDVVFQIDSNGLWIYLNPVWQELTGFTISESLGKSFLDYVFQGDQERSQKMCEILLAREKTYYKYVARYIHKGGGYRWLEVFAQSTLDKHNDVTGITGTLTDITERKKAEEALLESEQRFRDIAENVDELFWIRDLNEPRFLYMNSAYENFSGQKRQYLYENPFLFLNFILKEDRQKVMDYFLSDKSDLDFQFRAWHQDGSIRWLSVRLFTVTSEDGVLMRRIGMATDITTSIEKELILEESLTKERNLNALKSQFIAIASHEFRTPLATISSSVELLKHYVNVNVDGSATALINTHIDKIFQKVFSLNDLISDTLTISKIEEGRIIIHSQLTDLIHLCDDMIKSYFTDREDNRHVDFIVTGNPVAVTIDKKIIEHILLNLLSNAFKFSTKNPSLKVSFEKTLISLSIKDEGIGIPEKDMPNLFGKFFRASNAATFQGTGLGLAICQEYIMLQKGQIDVETEEGIGTTFKVTLPLTS